MLWKPRIEQSLRVLLGRASASGALPVKPGDISGTPVKTGDISGGGPAGTRSSRQSNPLRRRTRELQLDD